MCCQVINFMKNQHLHNDEHCGAFCGICLISNSSKGAGHKYTHTKTHTHTDTCTATKSLRKFLESQNLHSSPANRNLLAGSEEIQLKDMLNLQAQPNKTCFQEFLKERQNKVTKKKRQQPENCFLLEVKSTIQQQQQQKKKNNNTTILKNFKLKIQTKTN